MALTYLDFDVDISPSAEQHYTVAVRSHAGQARQIVALPFTNAELETHLVKVENALLRSASTHRKNLTPSENVVQTFGQHLFDFLLSGELLSQYRECQREANHQGKGVRWRLHIQTPRLAMLPWEFLYDPRKQDYVCLDPNTPLVRYSELPQTTPPLAVKPPLRILGVIAAPVAPGQTTPLNVMDEKQRVQAAVRALEQKGLVEVTWLDGETALDVQRAMRRGPWHIVHFIGHGGFDAHREEGLLWLADEQGQPARLYATPLARLFASQRASLRLVLLNSCEGARGGAQDLLASTAATLINRGIPAVLAMQYEITDRAAVQFARTFYEALADNLPVDAAVADARNAINLRDQFSLEWGTPVLYMRAPDGVLFALDEATSQSQPCPAPAPPPVHVQPTQLNPAEEAQGAVTTGTLPVQSEAPYIAAKPLERPALFVKLRSALATLYADGTSARRIATDAGLNITRIPFIGQATNDWHAILREAENSGRVDEVLAVAQYEYGENAGLREAIAAWRAYRRQGDQGPGDQGPGDQGPGDQGPGDQGQAQAEPAGKRTVELASLKTPAEVRMAEKRADPAPVYPATTIDFEWVPIPAGEFLMGSDKAKDKNAYDDELPQHKLYLPEYRMARVPVTNEQYKQFVAATGYPAPGNWQNGQIPKGKEKHPVVKVNWHDALAFCGWAKVRLPTEAEWEKAARGTDGRIYPWGNNKPNKSRCNFNRDVGDTTPVDKYPKGASFYGCLDMASNVWEWTQSLWGKDGQKPDLGYPYVVGDGRENLKAENNVRWVVRGGAFHYYHNDVRCAVRFRLYPVFRLNFVGFRLVVSPSPLFSAPSVL